MPTLVSIETTPNPNSMKLNFAEILSPTGAFTLENRSGTPESIQKLFDIHGIQNIYIAGNFLTLNRNPRVSWPSILDAVRPIFEENAPQSQPPLTTMPPQPITSDEAVSVEVQTFRNIPIQVKVRDTISEERVGLSERFGDTARELQTYFAADYLKERTWNSWGTRYGTLKDIAQEVAEEIESTLDAETLHQQKQDLLSGKTNTLKAETTTLLETSQWHTLDWPERLRMLQQMPATEDSMSLLLDAITDEKPQIRRWAAARLGSIPTPQSIMALSKALLDDENVGVRRTAGDSLSDIGDNTAQEAVCQALLDKNKLVRWRAARFLAEVGDKRALTALEKASNDSEYEVRLEVKAALHHIQSGSKATEPVWKQMSQRSKDEGETKQ